MSQAIPIFLASNDKYAPFVATTILSIIKNTKSFINFYVLDNGISELNQQKILDLKKQFNNFSVEFIDMKKLNLERFPNIKHYSVSAFSRYFISELKPDLEKVLYMDVDIIVKGDISELYNQDLDKYPIGAILEDFYPPNYTYLKGICPGYNGGSNYFNSGVLLMNLDYFRKNNLTQKLIDKTIELKDLLNCADQDIFNIIFENNFKILDYKFNVMPDHGDYVIKLDKKEAIEAFNNPFVIHYTGNKPWKNHQTNMFSDFWEIAMDTPFYEELKQEFYFIEKPTFLKLEKKLCKYNILSRILWGKTRTKYKQKLKEAKEKREKILIKVKK